MRIFFNCITGMSICISAVVLICYLWATEGCLCKPAAIVFFVSSLLHLYTEEFPEMKGAVK